MDLSQQRAAVWEAVDRTATAYTEDAHLDVEEHLRGELAARDLPADDAWVAETAQRIRAGHSHDEASLPGSMGGDNGGG